MDDTKKALLSIDIDTTALTQNVTNAKVAVADLTAQLNALKAAGQANTPVFAALSTQLKSTSIDLKSSANMLKAYTMALQQKTNAEQAATTAIQKNNATILSQQKQQATELQNIDNSATAQRLEQLQAADLTAVNQQSITNQQLADMKATGAAMLSSIDAKRIKDEEARIAASAVLLNKERKSITDYYDEIKKLESTGATSTRSVITQEMQLLETKDKAYATSADKFANVFRKTDGIAKAAILAKKIYAIAELAINTEQQISSYISATASAVKEDMSIPIVGPVLAAVDIAGGAIEVAGVVANGVKQAATINSISLTGISGFAKGGKYISDGNGGYLNGPGSGTSDNINAYLSNGESVINARSTQMFAPILSAINQAGGGVPFNASNPGGTYALGGLFNGANTLNDGSSDLATARATNNMIKTLTANMPRQVLVVEDVQASLQNKVMLQNMSNF